ncbi:SMP-30/gluconolactonase/LRE family protein [Alteraurantiacibacter aquimixticola]|uniref:SMP-30/Gluconolactonase/LRE-like region domain-containing protein n=1 Tax=Alteraurantiacibacter aquimixticola TaxID=2489173 RepID=A0A4T3F1C1_9SPHN|nr:hypothetical protein [Alteraurantiacibacter aquimixticola]TIX50985.1 hypothetical protein E5222_00415 [Alteraurantiacibacter aquimixticola]
MMKRGMPALALLAVLGACAQGSDEAVAEAPPPEIVMEGERLFPESITSDAVGNIYIGSNPGMIFRTSAGSDSAPVWIAPDEENGLMSVFGVLADDARGLLWVCTNPNTLVQPPQEGAPSIKTFSLADGSLQATYPFPTDGPAMCNDMAIAANGDVYASEMLGGRILRLPNGGDAWEVFAVDEEFGTIDGIAIGEDGTLYANAIQRNTLLRVNVDEAGGFTDVTVLTPSREMGGPDGLRPIGGNRFLQSEGNSGMITLVTIEGDNAQIEVLAEGIDYASSVTAVDGRAFYPEGKLSFLFDPNKQMQDPGEFRVFNVEIPGAE